MSVLARSTTRRVRRSKLERTEFIVVLGPSHAKAGWHLVRIPQGKDETGKRKFKHYGPFEKLEDAQARIKQHFEELKEEGLDEMPVGRQAAPMTLGEWAPHWLDHIVRPKQTANTFDQYSALIKKNVLPRIGSLEPMGKLALKDLTKTRIEKWRDVLVEEATASVATAALKRLKTCLAAAVKDTTTTGLKTNPAADVELPAKDESDKEYEGHPTDTLRLVAAAGASYMAALPLVATDAGLRRSEIGGLHWGDIDWDNKQLILRWHLVGSGSAKEGTRMVAFRPGTKMRQGPRKGQFERVNLSDPAIEALAEARQRLREHKVGSRQWARNVGKADHVFYAKNPRDRTGKAYVVPSDPGADDAQVFPAPDGTVLVPSSLGSWFDKLVARAGINKTLHGMRHDSGSFMLHNGVPLTVVSRHLRHANTAITAEVYSHMIADDEKLGAEAMGRMWASLGSQAVAV